MYIIKIEDKNMVNGPGLRCVIWCAGCEHQCPGCHNPEAQKKSAGHWWTTEDYDRVMQILANPEIDGVTFSGGEVTFPANREEGTLLMRNIKEQYPNKTIWVYSGYRYEILQSWPMIKYIDVLVDGPYRQAYNPGRGKLKWRGSTNQRIIDVQKSLKTGQICEYVEINGLTVSENELLKKNEF